MKPHHLVFGAAGLMFLSSFLLGIAEDFTRASGVFTGILVVCGIGWGMLLTERNDAARRLADAEEKSQLSKKHALKGSY